MEERKQNHSGKSPASPKDRLAKVLKWVGAATAVLSLVFALQKLTEMISEGREIRREREELLATAESQRISGNYDASWQALERAAHLDEDNRKVQTAREDLGIEWLQNIRVREGERTFTEIAGMIAPVLARGATLEEGQRKADLIAHLGWADFLRYREGDAGLQPDVLYRQALEADPDNVYAHTMLGHWLSWRHGDSEEMKQHFAHAGAEGREQAYVRAMRFAALQNRGDEASDAELMRMAVEWRRSGEPMEEDWRWDFIAAYDRLLRSHCQEGGSGAAAVLAMAGEPLDEHAASLEWLAASANDEYHRVAASFYRACILEAGGQPEAALEAYRQAHALHAPASAYARGIEAALERLTVSPVNH